MLVATFTLVGISPYSQSRPIQSTRDANETHDEFDKRCWQEHCHVDDDGQVFIPPAAIKQCISDTAQYLSIKIPGKRNATYSKHFKSGIIVDPEPMKVGMHIDDVEVERLYLNADGKRGSGTRVWRHMPKINNWSIQVKVFIPDIEIGEKIFEKILVAAGQFTGLGRYRPQNGGWYGRFIIKDLEFTKQELVAA